LARLPVQRAQSERPIRPANHPTPAKIAIAEMKNRGRRQPANHAAELIQVEHGHGGIAYGAPQPGIRRFQTMPFAAPDRSAHK